MRRGSSQTTDFRNRFRVPYDFVVELMTLVERKTGGEPWFPVGEFYEARRPDLPLKLKVRPSAGVSTTTSAEL